MVVDCYSNPADYLKPDKETNWFERKKILFLESRIFTS